MKKALISGITGQDGSYLAELLLSLGYEVHGIMRRVGSHSDHDRLWRVSGIKDSIHIHHATLESYASICKVIKDVVPDEFYHLAAQSFVTNSFEDEFSTMNTNINGTHFILSALREYAKDCRFYFAGSSEQFGKVEETPQTETTRFHPRSPYAISKVAGYELTRHYREAYGMFCCSGLSFNHESQRRSLEFVTRKIAAAVGKIYRGSTEKLCLGNIQAKRDWGYAGDYVHAFYLMLQQPTPDDFVIATNETHSVEEFIQESFQVVGIYDWQDHVEFKQELNRPSEVALLQGNYAKAHSILGWTPNVHFKELVKMMVRSELNLKEAV